MKFFFRLALKNLLRSKWRAVLTFLVQAFGVAIYITLASILAGFDQSSLTNLISFEAGHFKIRSAQFDPDQPNDLSHLWQPSPSMLEKLSWLPFVSAMTPRLTFLAEMDNSLDTAPVMAIGVASQTDARVFSWQKFLVQGRLEPGGAVLGKRLAEDFQLSVGDAFFLTFRNPSGMLTSQELRVSALLDSPDPKASQSTVILNLAEAQRALGTSNISELAIITPDMEKTGIWRRDLEKSIGPEAKVYSWQEIFEDVAALTAVKRKAAGILLLLVMTIAVFGIINTMLMSVLEKKKEIGTLKALGMTDREVRAVFLWEGTLLGVAGGLAGLLLGSVFTLPFAIWGMDITALLGGKMDMAGFQVMGVIRSVWAWDAYVQVFILAVLSSLAASYYPARKVTLLQPMECLRIIQ